MLLPKIVFHDELPQWITSSDIAAYHPALRTIHIRRKLGLIKTIKVMLHELMHHIIHIFNLPPWFHKILDS